LSLQNIYAGINDGSEKYPTKILEELSDISSSFQSFLPTIENLITTSPDLYDKAKKDLPVTQYLRGVINFKAAGSALLASVEEIKFMIANTIPGIKEMLTGNTSKKDATADSKI
jgi:hypothetical protein